MACCASDCQHHRRPACGLARWLWPGPRINTTPVLVLRFEGTRTRRCTASRPTCWPCCARPSPTRSLPRLRIGHGARAGRGFATGSLRAAGEGRVLIVASSLGDVVHAMPAVQDVRRAWPNLHIDWVVERVCPLVARCEGVNTSSPSTCVAGGKAPFAGSTCQAWRAFREDLSANAYDVVVDLQGLTKSALVAHWPTSSQGGGATPWPTAPRVRVTKPHALGGRCGGSVGAPCPCRAARLVCAQAFSWLPESTARRASAWCRIRWPCNAPRWPWSHGSSRADKRFTHPLAGLGRMLNAQGFRVALVHGNDSDASPAKPWHRALPDAEVWPAMELDRLIDHLAGCAGGGGEQRHQPHRGSAGCAPSAKSTTSIPHGAPARRPWARRQISVYAAARPSTPSGKSGKRWRCSRDSLGVHLFMWACCSPWCHCACESAHGPKPDMPRPSRALWALWRAGCWCSVAGHIGCMRFSPGETGVAVLVAQLRQALPGIRLLLTHGTATGRTQGQSLLREGDVQVWLPWDTPVRWRGFWRGFAAHRVAGRKPRFYPTGPRMQPGWCCRCCSGECAHRAKKSLT